MKKLILIFTAIIAVSCSKEQTLQKYFVENSESSEFVALDLGSSIINTEKVKLTDVEKDALESFEKLNVLAYKKDSLDVSGAKYLKEKEKVANLLKDDKYEQLVKFGNSKGGASVYMMGEGENIDEVVIFANEAESGFVVARVLGDDMTPNNVLNIVDVIRKADIDVEQLKPLKEAFDKK